MTGGRRRRGSPGRSPPAPGRGTSCRRAAGWQVEQRSDSSLLRPVAGSVMSWRGQPRGRAGCCGGSRGAAPGRGGRALDAAGGEQGAGEGLAAGPAPVSGTAAGGPGWSRTGWSSRSGAGRCRRVTGRSRSRWGPGRCRGGVVGLDRDVAADSFGEAVQAGFVVCPAQDDGVHAGRGAGESLGDDLAVAGRADDDVVAAVGAGGDLDEAVAVVAAHDFRLRAGGCPEGGPGLRR